MTHPFWILNALLSFLTGCVYIFIYFSFVKVPVRESVESFSVETKISEVKINIEKIYENDLFDTYKKAVAQVVQKNLTPAPPPPPQPQRVEIPEAFKPTFLDPLKITLKGIIVVGTNDAKNRVIIQDDETNQERMIKVGDSFQDAQLIRIFKNKIIFLRSNGQQEILYLREYDAKMDPAYSLADNWEGVIKKIDVSNFKINSTAFVKRITNLSQFIQLLSLTTAYKQGESIGCAIGDIEPQSLGVILGFQSGDIITLMLDQPIKTVSQRLAVYKKLLSLHEGDTFTVEFLRNGRVKRITYTLENFTKQKDIVEEEKNKLEEKVDSELVKQPSYAHIDMKPAVEQIRKRDRKAMMSYGKHPNSRNQAS